MMIDFCFALFNGIFGFVIGSFLNVIIYRVPRGESIWTPGSHCPICNHFLRPWELIPVISFLFLRGKCNKCGISISLRYPAIEILTGILFTLTVLLRPERTTVGIICDLLFVSLLIALTFIDIDTLRLPDVLVVLVGLIGFVNTLTTEDPILWRSLIGALIAGGFFFIVYYFYPEGMGLGDVKFAVALGLYLGFPAIIAAVFIASFLGTIIGGLRIFLYKKNLKDPIPFGPFLASGALIMLLFRYQVYNFLGF